MAGTVRDLYMAVRVVDRARGPLRAIANDVRRFQTVATGPLAAERKAAESQAKTLANQRTRAQAELQSIQSGKIRQALDDKQLAHAERMRGLGRLARNQALQLEANQLSQLQNLDRIQGKEAVIEARRRGIDITGPGARTPNEKLLKDIDVLNEKQNILQQRERNIKAAINDTNTSIGTRGAMTERLATAETGLIAREKGLTAAITEQGAAIDAANARSAAITSTLEKFDARMAMLSRRLQIGRVIKDAGHFLFGFGVIATAAFGLAAKAASDFQTESTQAATQSVVAGRATVANVLKNSKIIQAQIQKILRRGAVAGPSEQASAAYEIFSGVTLKGNQIQQLKQGASLLREFNKAAVANYGLVSLEEITRAGIILMNRFNLTVGQVPKALNTMQAAVRYGKLNMSEFISTLNQAAPAAQGAGQNLTQMSAAIAFISRQFPGIRLGATGYARLLETLARKDVVEGLRRHGVEITHIVNGHRKLLPINEIAARVVARFGGNVKEGTIFLQNFFKEMGNTASTIQARRVLVAYTQHLAQAQLILRQVSQDQGELNRSFLAMSTQPGVKLSEVMNRLRGDVITLGNAAIPTFVAIGIELEKLLGWFEKLSPHTRAMIGKWGAFAGVAALVVGIVGTLGGAFINLVTTLQILVGARALGGVGAEAGLLSARLGLLLGSVSLLIFLFATWPHQMMSVINALGGLKRVIEAIVLIKFGVMAANFVRSMALMGAAAVLAEGEVAALALTLAALPVAGIVIPIVILTVFHDQITGAINRAGNRAARAAGLRVGENNLKPRTPTSDVFRLWGLTSLPGKPGYGVDNQGNWFKWNAGKMQFEEVMNPALRIGATHGLGPHGARRLIGIGRHVGIPGATKEASRLGVVATASFQKLFQNMVRAKRAAEEAERQFKKHKITLQQLLTAEENYTNAQSALKDNATKQQYSAALKAANAATAVNKDGLDQQAADTQSTLDAVHGMYQQLYDQNKSLFGDLFQGPMRGIIDFRRQWGVGPTGKMLNQDLQGQIRQFGKFEGALNRLRRKGAPESLIEQIRSQGISALPELLALTRMPKGMWNSYVRSFNEAQNMIKNQTMRDLANQLAQYRKFGANVGQAIQDGIASESPGLKNEIAALVKKMFPSLNTGGNAGGTPKKDGKTTHVHYHDHATVHQHKGEGGDATLSRHRNRMRNRPHYGGFHPGR